MRDEKIENTTVLVLGAGASAPYLVLEAETGAPARPAIGRDFVNGLCRHPTQYRIDNPGYAEHGMESLVHNAFQEAAVKRFRDTLTSAEPPTIDVFLSQRTEFSEIGRAAIAATLIACENRDNLTDDWYEVLRNLMGYDYRDLLTSIQNLSVITFNYDRSFEYYFKKTFAGYYGEERAIHAIKRWNIIHVYGQLGEPDFLSTTGRPYAPDIDMRTVTQAAAQLKIISDKLDRSEQLSRAWPLIQSAETICFVGFGYDPTNVERLKINGLFRGHKLLGTAYHLNPKQRRNAISLFKSGIPLELGAEDETAKDFFESRDPFEKPSPSDAVSGPVNSHNNEVLRKLMEDRKRQQ